MADSVYCGTCGLDRPFTRAERDAHFRDNPDHSHRAMQRRSDLAAARAEAARRLPDASTHVEGSHV